MKALIYHAPEELAWAEIRDPRICDPRDAIVRIDTTTICGTDLHIRRGSLPDVAPGRVLGHEAVGTVMEVGRSVAGVVAGDRVLIPAITNCGRCVFCTAGLAAHCRGSDGLGWIHGRTVNGTQAEYVRTPYADTSLVRVPDELDDEAALFVSDVLPSGFELGVLNGDVREGSVVAVLGCGPVGLATMMTARMHGASRVIAVDRDPSRLLQSRDFGSTDTVEADVQPGSAPEIAARLRALTEDGLGVDTAVEAVGSPAFTAAIAAVRPGGTMANIGVHSEPAMLDLPAMWRHNVTIRTGLVSGRTIPELLQAIAAGRIEPHRFVTHRFPLAEIMTAYAVFANATEYQALKVVLTA